MSRETVEQDQLPADDAREQLFDEILEQLARCDLFSNTILENPTIFPVYAHENDSAGVGTAHASCVHDLIRWFQRIKAGILSDKSALHPLTSELEDTSALRNIIANQIRLLPFHGNVTSNQAIACIDKVLVCGSGVLKEYCETTYASQYIDRIVNICNNQDNASMKALKLQLESFVHGETGKDGFHHVLTEIAFLKVRKSRRPDRHGIVPVALDGAHHLRYLSVFGDSDITFKLKSTTAADRHALFFQLLEQLFVQHNALVHDFNNCYKKVVEDLKLPANGKKTISRNHFHNCLNSNMTKMYHKHWSTFSTAMRNGKFNEYTGILARYVIDILDETKDKQRRKILQWVSPMTAPQMPGKYQDGRAKRLDGTCDWVVKDEKFTQWYESEASAIISLQGRMGMGKTHATSRVIEWVQSHLSESHQHMTLAYFYCIEQDEMRSTAMAIMRSIVRQVAAGPTEGALLDEVIVKMWEKHGQGGQSYDTSTFDDWEDCLSELVNNYHQTTIVLDALDECKSAARTDLTTLFTSLAARCSNLKMFVSTRPEPELSRWLDCHPSISMHDGRTSGDIAAFVRDKIAQHSEWPYINDELKELMLSTITEKSQGLFLCAHLQIENLQDCLFEEDIRDGLTNLPQKLTELYEKLYLRATIKPAEKKYRDRAIRWVLCSLKPLTSDELLYAISQNPHSDRLSTTPRELTKRLILKSCHNFLTLDLDDTKDDSWESREEGPPTPVWRLAHQAVAEFFENSATCSEERAEMHFEAGKVCMMMTLHVFGDPAGEGKRSNDYRCPCGTRAITGYPAHFDLQEPLGEYAVHAWPIHMRANEHRESRNSGELSQMLLRFLTGPKDGTTVYQRWVDHASTQSFLIPWSSLEQRPLPQSFLGSIPIVSPLSLACYLGFPQTVNELLTSAGLKDATFYNLVKWLPWPEDEWDIEDVFRGPLRWSPVALACAHDEAEVLQRLLTSEPPDQLGISTADEVPPIVAAAVGDSIRVARELLQPHHGLSLSSSFTGRHGHVLRFAILGDSLQVLSLLLDEVLLDSHTLEAALSSVRYRDFKSKIAISLLLKKGVKVNTLLQDGTLLAAAVSLDDDGLVADLLERGADANMQFPCTKDERRTGVLYWRIQNALELCMQIWTQSAGRNRASIARLLVKSGATVTAQAVVIAFYWVPHEGAMSDDQSQREEGHQHFLRLLITTMSDPNEMCKDEKGRPTCALHEAVRAGNVAGVELLLDRGADPTLSQEGATGKWLSTVFRNTVVQLGGRRYPTHQMITLLEKAGADFGILEGQDLNMALAAAAWAGLTSLVHLFLERGADPNALLDSRFITALGEAVASGQPEASEIVRMLLDRVDVNVRLPYQGRSFRGELVLDFPLWLMLDKYMRNRVFDYRLRHFDRFRNLVQSAFVLSSNGAVWDVDFAQWRECLRQVEPEFESQEAETLHTIQENLERNWYRLSASQKESDEWRIKDPLAADFHYRNILDSMKEILHRK